MIIPSLNKRGSFDINCTKCLSSRILILTTETINPKEIKTVIVCKECGAEWVGEVK